MNYSYSFNEQGEEWWPQAYLKLISGKCVLGQIGTTKHQERKKEHASKVTNKVTKNLLS